MPYKNREDRNACLRRWRKRNVLKSRDNVCISKAKMVLKSPWHWSYKCAKERCENPNNAGYKYYGGRGIKFLLTKEDVGRLWVRDNASVMKDPTIDRIDNSGNYELNNCRFIERVDNVKKELRLRRNAVEVCNV